MTIIVGEGSEALGRDEGGVSAEPSKANVLQPAPARRTAGEGDLGQ